MFNLDDITSENNKDHNKKWPYIPFHIIHSRMIIIGGSWSGKTNSLFHLIKEQDSDNFIDKIYLYSRDLNKKKYQFLSWREDAGIKHLNDRRAFIEYLQSTHDVYNNIDDYNPSRKRKVLIVFDDMIADIMTYKKLQAIIKLYDCKYYD